MLIQLFRFWNKHTVKNNRFSVKLAYSSKTRQLKLTASGPGKKEHLFLQNISHWWLRYLVKLHFFLFVFHLVLLINFFFKFSCFNKGLKLLFTLIYLNSSQVYIWPPWDQLVDDQIINYKKTRKQLNLFKRLRIFWLKFPKIWELL